MSESQPEFGKPIDKLKPHRKQVMGELGIPLDFKESQPSHLVTPSRKQRKLKPSTQERKISPFSPELPERVTVKTGDALRSGPFSRDESTEEYAFTAEWPSTSEFEARRPMPGSIFIDGHRFYYVIREGEIPPDELQMRGVWIAKKMKPDGKGYEPHLARYPLIPFHPPPRNKKT